MEDSRIEVLNQFFFDRFGVTLHNHEKFVGPESARFFSKDQKLRQADVVDFVYKTPIEEVSIFLSTKFCSDRLRLDSL